MTHGNGSMPFGNPAMPHAFTSTKVPPSWSPEMQSHYSFQDWVDDVNIWKCATDVQWQQQGPMVALQLGGLAREIARQVPTIDLMNGFVQDIGDGQGAIWRSGVDLLLYGLSKKFGSLTAETAINDMTALVAFRRRAGEPVDEALARWDLLRHRAEARGGFVLQPPQAGWMVLNALGIPSTQWAQFLAPLMGNLPSTNQELTAMLAFIRRQGHLYESTGLAKAAMQAPKNAANFLNGTDEEQQVFGAWGEDQAMFPSVATRETGSQAAGSASPWGTGATHVDGSAYAYGSADDGNSTDTSEADGRMDLNYLSINLTPASTDADVVQAYNAIKARWRSQAGRTPRRYRTGKGKGKSKSPGRGRGGWSFLEGGDWGHRDYYGGKGGSKGGARKNPRGRNGETLKCDHCGSDEHLWRKCTAEGAEEYQRKRAAAYENQSFLGVSSTGGPTSSTLSTGPASGSGGAMGRWHQMTGQQPPAARRAHFHTNLCLEAKIEEVKEDVKESEQVEQVFGVWEGSSDEEAGVQDPLDQWYMSPKPEMETPTPRAAEPSEGLKWFMGPAFPSGEDETREAYLKSTRLDGPGESLLIDLGAYDNLTGDAWARRAASAAELAGEKSEMAAMDRSIGVEGVGAGSQKATELVKMPGMFKTTDGRHHKLTYEAPVIPNSDVPALWGHKSLARNRAVIDTVNRKIHLCGNGDIRFTPPPGTLTCDMVLSSSGHLLLPISEFNHRGKKDAQHSRELSLNFTSVGMKGSSTPSDPSSGTSH